MAEIEKVELRLRLDATITIYDNAGNATDWLKPGSEAAITWKGIPDAQQIEVAYKYLHARNGQTLEEIVQQTRQRLQEVNHGKQ